MVKVRLDQVGVVVTAVVLGAPIQVSSSSVWGVTVGCDISNLLGLTKSRDVGDAFGRRLTDHRGRVGVVELGVVSEVGITWEGNR